MKYFLIEICEVFLLKLPTIYQIDSSFKTITLRKTQRL
jgi:hypothetical protein